MNNKINIVEISGNGISGNGFSDTQSLTNELDNILNEIEL